MKGTDAIDDARRALLLRALAAGLFTVGEVAARPARAAALLGKVPSRLPPGRSFYEIEGRVTVNGAPATLATVVHAGDTVETPPGGKAIFAVGKDAFLMRAASRLETRGSRFAIHFLRMVSGRLLSVFGKSRHQMSTGIATIGIRGTGLYVESYPDESYVCTCYGTTRIGAVGDPQSAETIVSHHHNAPRYVLASGATGERIRPAPFINHTDVELALIEALVGRTPPFAVPGSIYGAPRRPY